MVDVNQLGVNLQHIASALRSQHGRTQQFANLGDVHAQRLQRGRRRLISPQLLDQEIRGHDLVELQEEDGERAALPEPVDGQRPRPLDDLQRPEQPKIHLLSPC